MPIDFYTRHVTLMAKVYGSAYTPPTREQWNSWCVAPKHKTSTSDFDIETEQREGWGYQDGGNT